MGETTVEGGFGGLLMILRSHRRGAAVNRCWRCGLGGCGGSGEEVSVRCAYM